MRKITFPELKGEDCDLCSGSGKLDSGDPQNPKVNCRICKGKGNLEATRPVALISYILKPKHNEQGMTRDQLRARSPIFRAAKFMRDQEMTIQDEEWTLLKKLMDERDDIPFGLDVDELCTAIEQAEHIKAAELVDVSRPVKRELRNK